MHQRAELLMSDIQDLAFSIKQIILKIALNSNLLTGTFLYLY